MSGLISSVYMFVTLTGVNICTLSLKLPIKIMMDIRWLSLSMRLNCIMKRSSSLRASRGFLSLSYCRRSFISASVGKKRIKHSTKSTRVVRRSNLQEHRPTWAVTQNWHAVLSVKCSGCLGDCLVVLIKVGGSHRGCSYDWTWTYVWIARQMMSDAWPAFRRVIARFLALLASSSEILDGPFWGSFCLDRVKSTAGPWALVLNNSSNPSTSRAYEGAVPRK